MTKYKGMRTLQSRDIVIANAGLSCASGDDLYVAFGW